MERQLRARLGAARVALGGKCGDERRMISRTQAAAVDAIAKRDALSLTPEAKANLVDFASAVNWHDGDLVKVLACLEEPEKPKSEGRRPMQQFAPGILGFFTAEEWGSMLKGEFPALAQDIVFGRILQLGGTKLVRALAEIRGKFFAVPDPSRQGHVAEVREQKGLLPEREEGSQAEG